MATDSFASWLTSVSVKNSGRSFALDAPFLARKQIVNLCRRAEFRVLTVPGFSLRGMSLLTYAASLGQSGG